MAVLSVLALLGAVGILLRLDDVFSDVRHKMAGQSGGISNQRPDVIAQCWLRELY